MSKPRGYYTLFLAYSHYSNLLKMQIPNGSVYSFLFICVATWSLRFMCATSVAHFFILRCDFLQRSIKYMAKSDNLRTARQTKQDEFYTRLEDIEK